ncbi:2-methylcitrate dehydratase PrpD [Paraburkholderia sp. BL23I1N1]|uniref:MmgE/PrpD family protein n=1 Tax=Paraburkholderia sp. BL23I1N1 TaxID=1938802 RepID=UPI000E74E704|nr:MmgE/PrpD family protein [Paraburkholderia sp. BL23I1N1]RKE36432.1 2-methylcitrate dehydratase PrpD [Paraburkholderia sp. BL23I1N1]
MADHPSLALATFAAQLDFESIPSGVVERTVNLYVDWLGAALAGKGARPVETIAQFARGAGGGLEGPSEVLIDRTRATPYFAAMVNAAASHFAEQDDVHNGSVFHPATVVFPVALALAQAHHVSGRGFIAAVVVGYETGIRIGEFLGRSHYKVFHTTDTAGTLAAAATAGRLLGLTPSQMVDAFGSAGTQASGLWEFLRDAADSKQLHTAMAAANGLMAAQFAADGFKGATRILEGDKGVAAGMSTDADPARLTDGLGTRWATAETSFKYYAACRHTHPAADALFAVVRQHALAPDDIVNVTAHVHQGALDVLGVVVVPSTVHQAEFNMGTVLGLVVHHGYAGVSEFENDFSADTIATFRDKVPMVYDDEVDYAYPARWIGKVTVTTRDGRTLAGRVDEPKGDPGNTLSRDELATKLRRLVAFSGAASQEEVSRLLDRAWQIVSQPRVTGVLEGGGVAELDASAQAAANVSETARGAA